MAYGGHQPYGAEHGPGGSGWANGAGQLDEDEEQYPVDEELRAELAQWHQQRAQIVQEHWRMQAHTAASTIASAPRDFLGLPMYPVDIVDHFMDDLNEVYVPERFGGPAGEPLDEGPQHDGYYHQPLSLHQQPAAPATHQGRPLHPQSVAPAIQKGRPQPNRRFRVMTPFEEASVEDTPRHMMSEAASPAATDLAQPRSEQLETRRVGPEEAEGAFMAGEGC